MEGSTSLNDAHKILGSDFIGPDELKKIHKDFPLVVPDVVPPIQFSNDFLKSKKGTYILLLCLSDFDGEKMTIRNLRNHFGVDPDLKEPCFYNQDWYLNEKFIDEVLDSKWVLIRKEIIVETRAQLPENMHQEIMFPPAISACYTFFVSWFFKHQALWSHDFIWCSDLDHNGDRVYVAKYFDIAGVNKNGFSIHRHLKLREFYCAIDYI